MSVPPAPAKRPWIRRRFLLVALGLPSALIAAALVFTTCMPGSRTPRPYDAAVDPAAELATELRAHVVALAETIGERNVSRPAALHAARDYVSSQFRAHGLEPRLETFEVSGVACSNVIAEIPGRSQPAEIVLLGAHYDSVVGSPGANDNGSGTAALLALARRLAGAHSPRTLRFVAFVNEEPPWFQTDEMGSRVHAQGCRARGENIVAMLSLETLGCYSDAKGSQRYPSPLLKLAYPSRGNFIAFVGNLASRPLVRAVVKTFRASATVPSEGAALPEFVAGVGWSDHESFWREGYPALMVTDTAVYRDPNYHTPHDLPAALDYPTFARVVLGLETTVRSLQGP